MEQQVESERGKIQHAGRAQQIIDFSGLRWGKITPTDTDGLLDFYDEAWVGYETKLYGTQIHFGQKLAFARLNDDLEKTGKPCIFIIAYHCQSDTNIPICAAETIVSEIRYKGEWHKLRQIITTKQLIDRFLKNHNIGTPEYSNVPF